MLNKICKYSHYQYTIGNILAIDLGFLNLGIIITSSQFQIINNILIKQKRSDTAYQKMYNIKDKITNIIIQEQIKQICCEDVNIGYKYTYSGAIALSYVKGMIIDISITHNIPYVFIAANYARKIVFGSTMSKINAYNHIIENDKTYTNEHIVDAIIIAKAYEKIVKSQLNTII